MQVMLRHYQFEGGLEGCFWVRTRPKRGVSLKSRVVRMSHIEIEPGNIDTETFEDYGIVDPPTLREELEGNFPETSYSLTIFTPWLLDTKVYEIMIISRYVADADPGLDGIHCAANWKMHPREEREERRRRARGEG